jgi:hypothetical protein
MAQEIQVQIEEQETITLYISAGATNGTVTSVAVSGSDGIEVDSGSPITTLGTIALGINKATLLAHINVEDGADVTDATNVAAAGATMDADTSLAGNGYFLDEDNMASDSATKVPSQQSVKAYVDAHPGAVGSVNGFTGVVVIDEEDIKGTVRTANVATTASLDWNAYSVEKLTMTADTTFSDSNLPTGANTKIKTLWLTGAFTATFPTYYTFRGDTYDGAVWNKITIDCVVGTTSSEFVDAILENTAI